MPDIIFLRDPALPFLEIKQCDALDHLAYKKHFHEEISIGLIEQGATRIWSAGKRYEAAQGHIVHFPPLLPHACHPENPADWKYTMVFIHPRWLDPGLPAIIPPNPICPSCCRNIKTIAAEIWFIPAELGFSKKPLHWRLNPC